MTNPIATVLSIAGNKATVEVSDRSACPRCAAGKGCGAGIFSSNKQSGSLTVRIEEGFHPAEGDQVCLSLASSDLARAATFAYGAPLAGLLIAAGCAYLLVDPGSDIWALILSAAGLVAGFAAGRMLARRDPCVSRLTPSIVGPAPLH